MDTVHDIAQVEETTQFLVEAEEKKNAPELAALEASVAFATIESTTEYTTEPTVCQVASIPSLAPARDDITLEEIEREIADAARQRIEAVRRELDDTTSRIERERTARDLALKAAQERVSQTQSALDSLASERAAMEKRAQTFLSGDVLKATLEKIHLAFNARQWELESTLATAQADVADAETEAQAASVSDALEMQLAEQELEQLESAAPDVAQAVQLAASFAQNIAAARQAVKDGLLNDAAVLLEQAKAANADSAQVAEVERALVDAKQAKVARDLIARLNANADQPGAFKRVKELMDEAHASGVAEKVAPFADRAWRTARAAANARFAQARPIADHLVQEGFVPAIGDGRVEAWKSVSHNTSSGNGEHGNTWVLDHVLKLRNDGIWATEKPRVAITRKTLTPRVVRSRWYQAWAASQNTSA